MIAPFIPAVIGDAGSPPHTAQACATLTFKSVHVITIGRKAIVRDAALISVDARRLSSDPVLLRWLLLIGN